MRSPKKFLERFDWLLFLLMITSISLYFWGTALNGIVMLVNNGSMPVNLGPRVFFSTGNPPRHSAKEGSARLLFLADIIEVDFPEIKTPKGKLGDGFREVARLMDYPLEGSASFGGVHYVSIGDLMRWVSVPLFGFTIFPLLLRIPFRLLCDGIRYVRRKP